MREKGKDSVVCSLESLLGNKTMVISNMVTLVLRMDTSPLGQILVGVVGLTWQETKSTGSRVRELWPQFPTSAYPLCDPEQVPVSLSFPICKMECGMNTLVGLV